MLAPLALASALALSGPPSDLIVPLQLSLNGNAITLSHGLWAAMAPAERRRSTTSPAPSPGGRSARREAGRPLTLGTVHPVLLPHLPAAAASPRPAASTRRRSALVVVPPQHSVEALRAELVDGFCAGAPWNAVAVAAGHGHIAALGSQLAPDAPEKVLAVSERLDGALPPLVRAVARAGRWCADPANRTELVHRLIRRNYLDLDATLVGAAFAQDASAETTAGVHLRFGAAIQEPDLRCGRWILRQMRLSQQIAAPDVQDAGVATVFRPDLYRHATTDL